MGAIITMMLFASVVMVIKWAIENRWSQTDVQNFTHAARKGSKMDRYLKQSNRR